MRSAMMLAAHKLRAPLPSIACTPSRLSQRSFVARSAMQFVGPGSEKLRETSCEGACSRETPLVEFSRLPELMTALPAWRLNDTSTVLTRTFTAKNFMAAIRFFNKLAEVAEAQGHHPDIHLRNYREVEVNVTTHAAGGLTMFDFVLCSKIDVIDVEYSPKWLQSMLPKGDPAT
ncbi:pterin 4 alpha carbinolamine dehydratase-domain-containing protein [Haematococcus lacustris]